MMGEIMKKNKLLYIFLFLQFLLMVIELINVNENLYVIVKLAIILYEILSLVWIKKNKQRNMLYILLSFIPLSIDIIRRGNSNIALMTNYLYLPLTIIFILDIYEEAKINKRNLLNMIITLSIFFLLLLLITKNINLNIAFTLSIIFPLLFIYFNKKVTFLNTAPIFITSLFFLYVKNSLLLIITVIDLVILTIYHLLTKKEKKIQAIILMILWAILLTIKMNTTINLYFDISRYTFIIESNNQLFDILSTIIYLLPLILVTIKIVKTSIKNKEKINFELLMLVLALLNTYIILFFNYFLLPAMSLVTLSYILVLITKKQKIRNTPLEENKITIIALHLGYGGIEQYISSLCQMLNKKYKIEIISTYKVLDKPAFYFHPNIKITYLINHKPNTEEFKRSIKKRHILSIIKEGVKGIYLLYQKKTLNIESIEDITSKYIITTREYHNELVGYYAREDIIKIATEHNYHNDDRKYIRKVTDSVKYFNYFVLVTNTLKEFYEEKVVPKCIYIPNVLDHLPLKQSSCKNHNLISVGRLSKEKGQKDLIDVVKLLKEKYEDIKLYLIGDGNQKETLENYIKQNNLSKNVILTGFLSKNDIELKMLDSYIFVTTSYTESFGLVVLEACSYKLPCVAFDSAAGIKELLEKGNGILVSNRDKKKMKEEIIKLFEDDKYRAKIIKNGYHNCKKYLSENISKEWFNLLK